MFHSTLQQLRLFESVARHLSYTRASEEVHLSQPAVSIQVKRLEEHVGTPLFEKMGKRLFLTPAGEELYSACQEIFQRLELVATRLDELRGEIAGPLRIGVVTTAKYILPHLLGPFLQQHPKIHPQLKVSNRARIQERLDDNKDDFYLFGTPVEGRDVEDHPFLDDQLVLFASPHHPLANKPNLPLDALAGERFLFREEGSGIRKTLEHLLKDNGLDIVPWMTLGSGEAIKQAAMAGLGIGMLSIQSLRLELEHGLLVPLAVQGLPIQRQWRIVHARGKQLSPATRAFIEFVLSNASALLPCCDQKKGGPPLSQDVEKNCQT